MHESISNTFHPIDVDLSKIITITLFSEMCIPNLSIRIIYLFIYTVNSCERFHPYSNRTSALTSLTLEVVSCFRSCNRAKTCKGISVSKKASLQCTMFVGEFPSQLGSFSSVWIRGLFLQPQTKCWLVNCATVTRLANIVPWFFCQWAVK